MLKSICSPNFDEICHSSAEIKLLPVLENDGHHFGILFPVSISKEGIVSGMSFYICLPNFVVIGKLAAKL